MLIITMKIFFGLIKDYNNTFSNIKNDIYIFCLSEHLKHEDKTGRLSMWRAYGGNHPVAIIINKSIVLQEDDEFEFMCDNALYHTAHSLEKQFGYLTGRLHEYLNYFPDHVSNAFLNYFNYLILHLKHAGFKEEKEWRLTFDMSVHSNIANKKHIDSSLEIIDGIPQKVIKLKLNNDSDVDLSIPKILNKIIIGPCEQPERLKQTFIDILIDKNVEDAENKVIVSGIPLRPS